MSIALDPSYLFSNLAAITDPLVRLVARMKSSPVPQVAEKPAVIIADQLPRVEESVLTQVHVISLRVVTYTQKLTNFAEQLRVQTHEQGEINSVALMDTLQKLIDFCHTVTQDGQFLPSNSMMVNGLSRTDIQGLIEGLTEGDKSIEEFIDAFVTASYQHPHGYQLCLAVVGSGGDWVGKVGVSVLRGIGAAIKQIPDHSIISSSVIAVMQCCWILEQAKSEQRVLH